MKTKKRPVLYLVVGDLPDSLEIIKMDHKPSVRERTQITRRFGLIHATAATFRLAQSLYEKVVEEYVEDIKWSADILLTDNLGLREEDVQSFPFVRIVPKEGKK